MSKHHLTHASEIYYGDSYDAALFALNGRPGVPIHPLTKVTLGSPVAAATDALIKAATSTELPNTETVTYTTATDNTSPLDGTIAAPSTVFLNGANVLVWSLDVPRALTAVMSHSSAVVASTLIVSGYDMYGAPMTELFTFTAGTTSKAVAGKKAFKYIYSYAITAAADAEANTLNVGFGDVLGLPYSLPAKSDLLTNGVFFNEVLEATAPTVVIADATTATNATGDVRGTVDLNSALDGSAVSVWYRTNPTSRTSLLGVTQA